MSKQPKAVVLISGGLDSATIMAIARSRGFELHGLSFDYGQRHRFELQSATNEYFNNAPVGQILIDRSQAIGVAPFKSVKYFPINDALQRALTRVDVDGSQSIQESWDQFVSDVNSL